MKMHELHNVQQHISKWVELGIVFGNTMLKDKTEEDLSPAGKEFLSNLREHLNKASDVQNDLRKMGENKDVCSN